MHACHMSIASPNAHSYLYSLYHPLIQKFVVPRAMLAPLGPRWLFMKGAERLTANSGELEAVYRHAADDHSCALASPAANVLLPVESSPEPYRRLPQQERHQQSLHSPHHLQVPSVSALTISVYCCLSSPLHIHNVTMSPVMRACRATASNCLRGSEIARGMLKERKTAYAAR